MTKKNLTGTEIRELSDTELDKLVSRYDTQVAELFQQRDQLMRLLSRLRAEQKTRASKKALGESEPLKLLKEQYQAAQRAFSAEREFGATDTEPDGEFQYALKTAFEGRAVIPTSASAWQLYSGMTGVGAAGKRLTQATRKVCKLIRNLPLKDAKHAIEFIDFWRVGKPEL